MSDCDEKTSHNGSKSVQRDKLKSPSCQISKKSSPRFTDCGPSTMLDLANTSVCDNRLKYVKNREVILHKVLKKLLKESGLKADSLANELDIPRSTFRSLMDGPKTKYDPITLEKLTTRFNIPLSYLLYGGQKRPRVDLKAMPSVKLFSGYAKITIEKLLDENEINNGDE